MMKYIYSLLLSALVGCFVISCQREVEDDLPGPPTGSANDSILLAKYVEIDTTSPPGSDTITKFLYTYDSRKRIIKYVDIHYHFPGAFTGDTLYGEYYYHGTDTLPYKASYDINVASSFFTNDTTFYFYSNGIVSRDSSMSWYHPPNISIGYRNTVTTYTRSGNNTLVRERTHYSHASTGVDDEWTATIFKTYNNGNITSQEDTSMLNTFFTGYKRTDVTYDNHPNPFLKTDIPYAYSGSIEYTGFNNPLTVKDILGADEENYTYSYQYRADGYPLIVRFVDLGDPTNNVKGFFIYTDH
jgi:hypothetical protein